MAQELIGKSTKDLILNKVHSGFSWFESENKGKGSIQSLFKLNDTQVKNLKNQISPEPEVKKPETKNDDYSFERFINL